MVTATFHLQHDEEKALWDLLHYHNLKQGPNAAKNERPPY